jgi:hypothetical protein
MTKARWIGLFAALLTFAGCAVPGEVEESKPELLYEGSVGGSPELSPDGEYLAIPFGGAPFGDDFGDLILLDVDSGVITNLTRYPVDGCIQEARFPRWSPDGEYVYFIEIRSNTVDWTFSIRRVPAAGGEMETVLTLPELCYLAIDGEGGELAFRYTGENWKPRLGRYDLATGRLTDVPGGEDLNVRSLAYTPEGAWLMASIVRDLDTPYDSDVVLFPPDGGEPAEFDCRFDWEPSRISFSPDGRTCLFQCYKHLFTVPVEGGAGTYIRPDVEGEISRGAWFSDGYIYFVLNGGEIWRYRPDL